MSTWNSGPYPQQGMLYIHLGCHRSFKHFFLIFSQIISNLHRINFMDLFVYSSYIRLAAKSDLDPETDLQISMLPIVSTKPPPMLYLQGVKNACHKF